MREISPFALLPDSGGSSGERGTESLRDPDTTNSVFFSPPIRFAFDPAAST